MELNEKTAIIIGAGPAGLTAAYELIQRTDIKPIIFEKTSAIGGISQTIEYKGNRIDIGGHRFFSKSDRVMNWWLNIMPLQKTFDPEETEINTSTEPSLLIEPNQAGPDHAKTDLILLVRNRLSRIFYRRKFFDYPVTLNIETLKGFGIAKSLKIGFSYAMARLFPIKQEISLEDFLINRFGKALYNTFFRDYTEKLWGIPCNQISSTWGKQRIKGLSISKAILHSLKNSATLDDSISQKGIETSLIQRFLYPKYGPGQMWEEVSRLIESRGGKLYLNHEATGLCLSDRGIDKILFKNFANGETVEIGAPIIFSTMPIKDLILRMDGEVPERVKWAAGGLQYRDFITVGLLLHQLKIKCASPAGNGLIPDNWIYIQERDVKLGRIQIFNNWSPYMVQDHEKVWIGLEYFCNEGDDLWSKDDDALAKFAINELVHIGIIDSADVLDFIVIKTQKAYPAYCGTYDRFQEISAFTDRINNLFLIGRNGMHKYNNQDHSMLSAMVAVDNIINGVTSRENIWSVNTDDDYQDVA